MCTERRVHEVIDFRKCSSYVLHKVATSFLVLCRQFVKVDAETLLEPLLFRVGLGDVPAFAIFLTLKTLLVRTSNEALIVHFAEFVRAAYMRCC